MVVSFHFLSRRGGKDFSLFTITGVGFLSDPLEEPFDCMQPMMVVRDLDPDGSGMMGE